MFTETWQVITARLQGFPKSFLSCILTLNFYLSDIKNNTDNQRQHSFLYQYLMKNILFVNVIDGWNMVISNFLICTFMWLGKFYKYHFYKIIWVILNNRKGEGHREKYKLLIWIIKYISCFSTIICPFLTQDNRINAIKHKSQLWFWKTESCFFSLSHTLIRRYLYCSLQWKLGNFKLFKFTE